VAGTVTNGLHVFRFYVVKKKMPSCSVSGCNNRSEKDRVRGVSFHSLPVKKPLVAKQWLDQIRRDKRFGPPEPKYVYVCSAHFTRLLSEDFHSRFLKTGSVPTIFKWQAPVTVPDISEAEQERKEEC